LVAGACLAENGNEVICVDKDAAKVRVLQRGRIPIYEPGLEEMVRRKHSEKRLTFTTALARGVRNSQIIFIAVGTPTGVEMLANSYEITVEDLQQALARQKLTLQPGDAAIIHTGWGKLWGKDNARYQATSPGIGVAAAEWLARQDPMLVGSDNGGVEVAPNPDRNLAGPIHQLMLVVNGIPLLENL